MGNTKSLGIAYTDQDLNGATLTNCTISNTTTDTTTRNLTATGNVALGNASSDLIAFYGATPVSQSAFVATAARVAVTGGVGFSTTAEFASFVVSMNSILTLLQSKGLMAAS